MLDVKELDTRDIGGRLGKTISRTEKLLVYIPKRSSSLTKEEKSQGRLTMGKPEKWSF